MAPCIWVVTEDEEKLVISRYILKVDPKGFDHELDTGRGDSGKINQETSLNSNTRQSHSL